MQMSNYFQFQAVDFNQYCTFTVLNEFNYGFQQSFFKASMLLFVSHEFPALTVGSQ